MPCSVLVQMDALQMLGYTMFISEDQNHMRELWRTYHQHVQVIIADPNKSRDYMANPERSFRDVFSKAPSPAPNATHDNIPVWYVE